MELIGPKIVQPPQNKTPHIKPVELGGGAQWPSKPTITTPSESPGGVRKQSKTRQEQKPTAQRGGTGDDPEEEQSPPRPPPRGNGGGGGGEMAIMVVEMMMGMMMETTMMIKATMLRMMKIRRQSLRVKMGSNKMHQEEEVMETVNHHLILGVEMWDLGVKEDIEVKEEGKVGQVHKVHLVHKYLRAHKV